MTKIFRWVGVVLVLLVALAIMSCIREESSPAAPTHATAAPTHATAPPTHATAPPTPVPTSPTEPPAPTTPQPTSETCPTSAEGEYLAYLALAFEEGADIIPGFFQINDEVKSNASLLMDLDWRVKAELVVASLNGLANVFEMLDPPLSLTEPHGKVLEVAGLLRKAGESYTRGIDEFDMPLLETGSTLIWEGTMLVAEVTDDIDAYCPQSG